MRANLRKAARDWSKPKSWPGPRFAACHDRVALCSGNLTAKVMSPTLPTPSCTWRRRSAPASVEGWSSGLRSQRFYRFESCRGYFSTLALSAALPAPSVAQARRPSGLMPPRRVAVFDANCTLSMQKADSLMAPRRTPRAHRAPESTDWGYVVVTNHWQTLPLPQLTLAAPRLVNVRFRWTGSVETYLPTQLRPAAVPHQRREMFVSTIDDLEKEIATLTRAEQAELAERLVQA